MSRPVIYISDFKLRKYSAKKANHNAFTVTLGGKSQNKGKFSKHSIVHAAIPLLYFASFLGIQTIGYTNNYSPETRHNKVYGLILILIIILLIIFVRPAYWDDTINDIPLKILNISQGIHETMEIVIFIFITSFRNSDDYIKLYKILNKIDEHLNISKKMFNRRRVIAVVLLTILILELSLTFWTKSFSVHHLVSQFILLLLIMQGVICAFFVINIYSMLITFNIISLKKSPHMHRRKQIALGTKYNVIKKSLVGDAHKSSKKNICWFELMQLYDKIADAMYIFNRIYSEQILIMFHSWFMSTLLLICRILSPTVQYSDTVIIELLLYFTINSRPLFLSKMSENFILERRKTNSIILHNIVYMENDYNIYKDQIQIMLELVQTRKIEISNNVFPINIPNMLGFVGRVISYAVLMIQYFYLFVPQKQSYFILLNYKNNCYTTPSEWI